MALTIDGTSLMDITLDGVNMKYVNLDNVLVFTRVDMPAFTTQPNGGSISSGASFTSSVVVSSGDGTLSYQWYLNNSAVSGATGASYTFSGLAEGSHTIRCEAWNERGRVVSNNTTITVAAAWTHNLTVGRGGILGGTTYAYGYFKGQFGSISPATITGLGTVSALTCSTFTQLPAYNSVIIASGSFPSTRIRVSTPAGTELTNAYQNFDSTAAFTFATSVTRDYLTANSGKTVSLKLEKA